MIMPGVPGAGKSTLCAALAHHGWRLLSDEQALISTADGRITPLARPICLKNESIDVIQSFCPQVVFGELVINTTKGDLTHIKAPENAINGIKDKICPDLIVFPQYAPEVSSTQLHQMKHGVAMIELITHCFNYTTLGQQGFTTLTSAVKRAQVHQLRYSNLDDAIEQLALLSTKDGLCVQS